MKRVGFYTAVKTEETKKVEETVKVEETKKTEVKATAKKVTKKK